MEEINREKLLILESDNQTVKRMHENSLLLLQKMHAESTTTEIRAKYTTWANEINSALESLETTVETERVNLGAVQNKHVHQN